MAQLAAVGPLDERDLDGDLRTREVRAARQAHRASERRRRDGERVEALAQREQPAGVEPGADLPGEPQLARGVMPYSVPDQQRAEALARALRIGPAADHELLRDLALHLHPVGRAPV